MSGKRRDKSLRLPVDDEAFPLKDKGNHIPKMLGIVGHCPQCGAPLYGHSIVNETDTPPLRYSCHCMSRRQGFENTVRTT